MKSPNHIDDYIKCKWSKCFDYQTRGKASPNYMFLKNHFKGKDTY